VTRIRAPTPSAAPGARRRHHATRSGADFRRTVHPPSDAVFLLAPLAQGGSYDAHDRLAAGYVMTEIGLSSSLRFIGGARYEADALTVNALSDARLSVKVRKDWIGRTAFSRIELPGQRCAAAPPVGDADVGRVPSIGSSRRSMSRDVLGGDDVPRQRRASAHAREQRRSSLGVGIRAAVSC
jgi:hypothetical protein